MALGFGLLRLSPHDFWSMTPREIAAAMARPDAEAAPDRVSLAGLMQTFPDSGDATRW